MKNLFEAVDSVFESDHIVLDEAEFRNSRIEALKDKVREKRLAEAQKLEAERLEEKQLNEEKSWNPGNLKSEYDASYDSSNGCKVGIEVYEGTPGEEGYIVATYDNFDDFTSDYYKYSNSNYWVSIIYYEDDIDDPVDYYGYYLLEKCENLKELDSWVSDRSKQKGWKVKVLDVTIDSEYHNVIADLEVFDPEGNSTGTERAYMNGKLVKIGETYPAYIDGMMNEPKIIGHDYSYYTNLTKEDFIKGEVDNK